SRDWSSDVCSSDLAGVGEVIPINQPTEFFWLKSLLRLNLRGIGLRIVSIILIGHTNGITFKVVYLYGNHRECLSPQCTMVIMLEQWVISEPLWPKVRLWGMELCGVSQHSLL